MSISKAPFAGLPEVGLLLIAPSLMAVAIFTLAAAVRGVSGPCAAASENNYVVEIRTAGLGGGGGVLQAIPLCINL